MSEAFPEFLISPDEPAFRDYVIEREIGGGGMSRLFVAMDTQLNRRVVIKVLAPSLTQSLSVDRFKREILLATSLQHPNIVPILAAGETAGPQGQPFFVMPYIEGESLRERLLRGPQSIREAVNIARDVARALAYAHERGIVHRDIKPGNVLMSAGAAVVTDFGVAKALTVSRQQTSARPGDTTRRPMASAHPSLTTIGTSLGTPAYMSPEQAAADPNVDHRADIYALGIVMYEMIVGAPPFHGRSPQDLLRAQLSDPPPPIASRRYDVPVRLATLIEQCLEKDPARRPRSTNDVIRWLEDPAVLSGSFAKMPAGRRRFRRLAPYAVVGAVLLASIWWTMFRKPPEDTTDALNNVVTPIVQPVVSRRIVVGPVRAIGTDKRAATIIDGLTSELATLLVTVPGLRVGSLESERNGAARAKPDSSATTAADTTGLLRLEGTVQRENNQLRILLRALDANGDSTIWSGVFDGSADSVLALQSRVTRSVVNALTVTLARPAR